MNDINDLSNDLFEPLDKKEQAMLTGANISITLCTSIVSTNGVTADIDTDVEYDNDFSN